MAEPTWTGFAFQGSAICMAVYNTDGDVLGITCKVGDLPMMMIPLVPIPDDAIRFDPERPG